MTIPVISVLVSHYVTRERTWVKTTLLEYGIDCAVLVLLANIVMYLLNKTKFVERFNAYPGFAVKFIVLMGAIAAGWGFFKGCILTNRRKIEFENCQKPLSNKVLVVYYYIVAFFIVLLNFVRIFNMTYWGDAAFSIRLAKMSASELIQVTAGDVHPPLYYLFMRAAYLVLGDHGYTYHLVSVIPVFIMIIFALTVVKKKYGKVISILFIAIETFMGNCFVNNLEIRNYSWANLFVFLCFWYGVQLIEKKKGKLNWVMFTIAGILAAYTHYYALISVAFIYLSVYIGLVANNKKAIWKCLLSGIVIVICYLPWLKILIMSVGKASSSWWSTYIPSIKECVEYMIGTDIFAKCLIALFGVSIIIYIVQKLIRSGLISLPENAVKVNVGVIKELIRKDEILNVFIAMVSILGTIGVGTLVSKLVRPLFLMRFTFVLVGMLGLCISIFIGKIFCSRKTATLVVLLLFLTGTVTWVSAYKEEFKKNKATLETVQYINSLYSEGDKVVSNILHLNWTVLDAYFDFPHGDYNFYSDDYLGRTSLILYNGDHIEYFNYFVDKIESNGGRVEFMKSGQIAQYSFDIYKVSFDEATK
jgi:hypothetical protein